MFLLICECEYLMISFHAYLRIFYLRSFKFFRKIVCGSLNNKPTDLTGILIRICSQNHLLVWMDEVSEFAE